MLMTYGRGRAEQIRVNPTFGSAPNFAPPLFCVYLAALIVVELVPMKSSLAALKLCLAAPLAVYAAAIFLQTLASIPANGIVRSVAAMPLLAAPHILYGIGFWRGLFTKLHRGENRPKFEVELGTVSL